MTDNSETFKGLIHLGVFALIAMCWGHNVKSYVEQRDKRHLVNLVIYTPILFFEGGHVRYHFRGHA